MRVKTAMDLHQHSCRPFASWLRSFSRNGNARSSSSQMQSSKRISNCVHARFRRPLRGSLSVCCGCSSEAKPSKSRSRRRERPLLIAMVSFAQAAFVCLSCFFAEKISGQADGYLAIDGLAGLDRPPGASLQIGRHGSTAFPVVATGALALVARAGQRVGRWFLRLNPQRRFPFHPPVSLSEKTSNNKVEYRRKSADLLCETVMQSISCARSTRETDGGGFEPPVPFGTHAFQACTINRSVTHPEQSSASSES